MWDSRMLLTHFRQWDEKPSRATCPEAAWLPGGGLALHKRHHGTRTLSQRWAPLPSLVCPTSLQDEPYVPILSSETLWGTSPLETRLGSESSRSSFTSALCWYLKHEALTCLGHSLQRIQNRLASWTEMFLRLFHRRLQLRNPKLWNNSQAVALFYYLRELSFHDK